MRVGSASLAIASSNVERLAFALGAISRVGSVLLRARSEVDLLAGACEAITHGDTFALAWVGTIVDDDLKSFTALASGGAAKSYLDGILISSNDGDLGNSPIGRASRTHEAQVDNDIQHSERFQPWGDRAVEANLRSAFCIPIRFPDRGIFAYLAVYSNAAEAFGPQEMTLFERLADDIGFGVERIRSREARRAALKSREQERHLVNQLMDCLPGTVGFFDAEARLFRSNENFRLMTGYGQNEILGKHATDFVSSGDRETVAARIREVFESGKSSVEARLLSKSGEMVPYLFSGRRVILDGQPIFVAVGVDISDRLTAESQLKEYTSRLKFLSGQILRVQEDERRRMGRELHDTVGQELAAVGLNLARLRMVPGVGVSDEMLARLDDSQQLLESASDNLRDILTELRPPGLDEIGLVAALRDHCDRLSQRSGIHVLISGAEPEPRLGPGERIATFRIIQEALNNAVKHSNATIIVVDVVDAPGCHKITVKDNGVGFDGPSYAPSSHSGMGFLTMRERAEAMDGQLEVDSMLGSGTTITVTLPRTVGAV